MPDPFASGVPFRLTGDPLRPTIEGGPGSAGSDEEQRMYLLALAARIWAEGHIVRLVREIDARMIWGGLGGLVHFALDEAMSTHYETALEVIDCAIQASESDDKEIHSGRPPGHPCLFNRHRVILRGVRMIVECEARFETADPEHVAQALDLSWPMILPWPPQPELVEGR